MTTFIVLLYYYPSWKRNRKDRKLTIFSISAPTAGKALRLLATRAWNIKFPCHLSQFLRPYKQNMKSIQVIEQALKDFVIATGRSPMGILINPLTVSELSKELYSKKDIDSFLYGYKNIPLYRSYDIKSTQIRIF
jgi:hypothetical protein